LWTVELATAVGNSFNVDTTGISVEAFNAQLLDVALADPIVNGVAITGTLGGRIIGVPMLNIWGLILMGLLLVGLAGFQIRRQIGKPLRVG